MPYSRPVKLSLLALAAAGLVALLVLSVGESRTIVVASSPVAKAAPLTPNPPSSTLVGALTAPRYTGRGINGEAWELTAANATQYASQYANQYATPTTAATAGQVSLTTITASWQGRGTDTPLRLSAPTALYEPAGTLLTLPQGVTAIGRSAGYHITLQGQRAVATLASSVLQLSAGVSATLFPVQ